MQDTKENQGKYTEFSVHDYLGDLKFEVILLEKVVSML